MKLVMRSKTAKSESVEKRFKRFATALMAVPKKELNDDQKPTKTKRKDPKGAARPTRA